MHQLDLTFITSGKKNKQFQLKLNEVKSSEWRGEKISCCCYHSRFIVKFCFFFPPIRRENVMKILIYQNIYISRRAKTQTLRANNKQMKRKKSLCHFICLMTLSQIRINVLFSSLAFTRIIEISSLNYYRM